MGKIEYYKVAGVESWHLNGKRHRDNGPAVTLPDGTKKYYIHGELIYTRWSDGSISIYNLN